MARNMYGATSADFTLTAGGRVVPGTTLTVWSARTGGTQVTDLLDVDSVACTTVTSGADGSVVFYGPDGSTATLWAYAGQGSRVAIRPTDISGLVELTQSAENAVWAVAKATPKTTGFAPFYVDGNSFANAGDGAGTYNHGAWLGFNTGRHSGSTVVSAAPASFIGLEDNYFDNGGDELYGMEFYWEVHPKSASHIFRPLYARASISTDGTTIQRAAVLFDIGTSGEGQFTVRKGMAGSALFNVTDADVSAYRNFVVAAQAISVQNTGGAFLIADGTISANLKFRIGGAEEFALRCFTGTLEVMKGAATLATFRAARLEVATVLAAGLGTSTPTLSTTANLGTSPPTPTIQGNASRGKVAFGTGSGSTAAGGVITVDFPAGSYDNSPTVVLTPANYATASKQPYISATSPALFQIALGVAPGTSQPADTYAVNYQVIG